VVQGGALPEGAQRAALGIVPLEVGGDTEIPEGVVVLPGAVARVERPLVLVPVGHGSGIQRAVVTPLVPLLNAVRRPGAVRAGEVWGYEAGGERGAEADGLTGARGF